MCPANLGYDGQPLFGDPRFKPESYISMGPEGHERLYYVLGQESTPARGLAAAHTTLTCENCWTEHTVQLDMHQVRRDAHLVRAARATVPAAGYRA
jgi:hypothetical protein